MAELINHNSAILFSIVILLVGAFILIRRGIDIRRVAAFGLLVVIVAAAFFSMRPSAGIDSSPAEITAKIGDGKPVLLEFQSQN